MGLYLAFVVPILVAGALWAVWIERQRKAGRQDFWTIEAVLVMLVLTVAALVAAAYFTIGTPWVTVLSPSVLLVVTAYRTALRRRAVRRVRSGRGEDRTTGAVAPRQQP